MHTPATAGGASMPALHHTNVILIGPPGVGKSTLAPLVAHALGLPVLDLDTERWGYYAELGYDADHAEQLVQEQGLEALIAYWKRFELHAVERVLADYPRGYLIAFGAGHSVYDDPVQFARVQQALAPYPYIVHLLPAPDLDESIRRVNARLPADDHFTAALQRIHTQLLRNPSNARLATLTVYTDGKTPAETCAAIVAQLTSATAVAGER